MRYSSRESELPLRSAADLVKEVHKDGDVFRDLSSSSEAGMSAAMRLPSDAAL
jgi:hypothetical protein